MNRRGFLTGACVAPVVALESAGVPARSVTTKYQIDSRAASGSLAEELAASLERQLELQKREIIDGLRRGRY